MIDDGVKGEGVEEGEVMVADIAMHLLDAIEEGEVKAEARMRNEVLQPTSQRVTADVIEAPLGYGMHLEDDETENDETAAGPIAALLADGADEEE